MKVLKATPLKWRKIGNALIAASIVADISFTSYGHDYIGHVAFGCGVLGKVIIAFLTSEESPKA